MTITIIAAMERSHGIGINNTLPWKLKSDLLHFKSITLGKTIVMGTTTLKGFKRPLPDRTTFLLSRQRKPDISFIDDVGVFRSVDEVLTYWKNEHPQDELIIAGGAQVYEAFIQHADKMILTQVDADVRSDTFFPSFGVEWELVDNIRVNKDENNEYPFNICTYIRRPT